MFANLTERLSSTLRHLGIGSRLTEKNVQDALREIRVAFLEADVALPVVREFVARVKERAVGEQTQKGLTPGQTFIKIVRDELETVLGSTNQQINLKTAPPAVILLAGLQGAGKTTTAAKLGRLLQLQQKKKVLLVSTDTQRPAAIEQLQQLATQLNIDCFATNPADKPTTIAQQALQQAQLKFYDILIVDTAGRLHIDAALMEELRQIHQLLQPVETLFIVDAMTGQDAANTAKEFDQQLPLTGIILSKADSDSRGGAALSMRFLTGKPIKFLGVGEKSDALEPFYPDRMASRILGMGDLLSLFEELEQKTDKHKREQLTDKFVKGSFNFEDFAEQLRQMSSMGGMASMLNRIPGSHQIPPELKAQVDDKLLVRMEAIINSMTRRERQIKDQIKGSRKRRIAAGAGVQVQDVNRLLKQFEDMQKMVKKMRSGGLGKMMRGLGGMFSSPPRGR